MDLEGAAEARSSGRGVEGVLMGHGKEPCSYPKSSRRP